MIVRTDIMPSIRLTAIQWLSHRGVYVHSRYTTDIRMECERENQGLHRYNESLTNDLLEILTNNNIVL